jgi:hypothetical protein
LQGFWSHWAWPLATAVLGFVFFGLVFDQWLRRRKPHQAAWSVGLLYYAVAALMEFWSEYNGAWNPTVYRVYIVLAASLVGFLGLGSLYLIARRRLWGHLYLAFNIICLIVFFVGALTVTLATSKLVPGITVGGQGLGSSFSFPRVMSFAFNIPGAIFLIGGALLTIWRFARRREFAYRVWANVLIALGALLIAFVGSRARMGSTAGLYPAEMVASALMLAGFLLAGTLQKGPESVRRGRQTAVQAAGAARPTGGDSSRRSGGHKASGRSSPRGHGRTRPSQGDIAGDKDQASL